MATFTYSADNLFLTIGGFPINGFQDGSEVSITMDESIMTKQVDNDGQNVVFNKTNNHTASITFTLNEGAEANDFLSAMYQAFRNGIIGGVLPVAFKDNNGRSIFASGSCAVMTLPNLGGGRESSGREWVMSTGQSQIFIGGATATGI
jgi:hypothetical protein